jgi:hypothetical protein
MVHDLSNANAAHEKANVGIGAHIARLLARVTGPMPIISATAQPTREGVPGPRVIGDDPGLLDLTKHVRKPKEKMLEFYARTGIGPVEIRSLCTTELARRVELAEQNAEADGYNVARSFFEAKAMPSRLRIAI